MENNDERVNERLEDVEGTIKAFRSLLTLITLELGWSNYQIKAFLRVNDEHIDFLRSRQ